MPKMSVAHEICRSHMPQINFVTCHLLIYDDQVHISKGGILDLQISDAEDHLCHMRSADPGCSDLLESVTGRHA